MDIVYRKLSEKDLGTIIEMRIDQLTEEYKAEGRAVPEGVDLKTSLMDFYTKHMVLSTTVISCS